MKRDEHERGTLRPVHVHRGRSHILVLLSFFSLSYRGARTIHALQIANLAFPLTPLMNTPDITCLSSHEKRLHTMAMVGTLSHALHPSSRFYLCTTYDLRSTNYITTHRYII